MQWVCTAEVVRNVWRRALSIVHHRLAARSRPSPASRRRCATRRPSHRDPARRTEACRLNFSLAPRSISFMRRRRLRVSPRRKLPFFPATFWLRQWTCHVPPTPSAENAPTGPCITATVIHERPPPSSGTGELTQERPSTAGGPNFGITGGPDFVDKSRGLQDTRNGLVACRHAQSGEQ